MYNHISPNRRSFLTAAMVGSISASIPAVKSAFAYPSIDSLKRIEDLPFSDDGVVYVNNIGYANTVSSGADNGANNCDASCLWMAMRHPTTQTAVDNWLSRLTGAALGICAAGHGAPGLVETGAGQNGPFNYKTNVLYSWNDMYWGPDFDRLLGRNPTILDIISCDTGAGEDGADLLFSIAKRIKIPVRARTGLTYCGSSQCIYFQEGSVWQVATPDQRPTPIPQTPHLVAERKGKTILLPINRSELVQVDINEVESLIVTSVNISAKAENTVSFTGTDEAKGFLLDALFSSMPYRARGAPLGFTTRRITIKVRGQSQDFTFSIINDKIAISDISSLTYIVSPALKAIIESKL